MTQDSLFSVPKLIGLVIVCSFVMIQKHNHFCNFVIRFNLHSQLRTQLPHGPTYALMHLCNAILCNFIKGITKPLDWSSPAVLRKLMTLITIKCSHHMKRRIIKCPSTKSLPLFESRGWIELSVSGSHHSWVLFFCRQVPEWNRTVNLVIYLIGLHAALRCSFLAPYFDKTMCSL